jgi:hypothetical protein
MENSSNLATSLEIRFTSSPVLVLVFCMAPPLRKKSRSWIIAMVAVRQFQPMLVE